MIDTKGLKKWFEREKRDFPWRPSPGPYAVWVSEMMLQQTSASVVVPYFNRWMERFPTLQVLAAASLDEVIKEWEGLGYYSRARYLHQGARDIVERHNGEFPRRTEDLMKIKGLGPYTLGAVRSFAFHERAAAVDGNVIRVLSRYFMIRDDVSKPKTVKRIRELAEAMLPESEPWIVSEALIELGATVCSRKPLCSKCPLSVSCEAHRHGAAEALPIKSAKVKTEHLFRAVAVIFEGDKLLLRRGKPGEVMSDLYEFPYLEIGSETMSRTEFKEKIFETWGLKVHHRRTLLNINHSFTRYRVHLFPVVFSAEESPAVQDFLWTPFKQVGKLAFSSGHRRVLEAWSMSEH